MGTLWAVNPSLALQGVSASVRQVGTRLRTHSAALIISQDPCASPPRDTSQGFLIFSYYQPRGWLTDESTGRFADVKSISLEQIICPGAQRGHGSTLWCDSLTIWRYLCCFPVGIWCQLYQDDACSGHLEVSLVDLIRGSWSFVNECWMAEAIQFIITLIMDVVVYNCRLFTMTQNSAKSLKNDFST